MFKWVSCAFLNCHNKHVAVLHHCLPFRFSFRPSGRSLLTTCCFVISYKNRVLNLDPGLSLRLHLEHRNLDLGDSLGWLLWRLRGKHCMFMTLVLLQLLEEVDECSSRNQWLVERVGRRGGHVSSSAPQKLLGCGEQSRAGWRPGRYEGSIILIISLLMVDLLGDICPDSWLLDLPFFVSNIFITRVVWVLKGDNQW